MAGVAEQTFWDPNVYRLEETDFVEGGEDGVDNLPHKNLADRTRWLAAQKMGRLSGTHHFGGGGSFASIEFATGMPDANYTVSITPVEDPQGDLGDVWVDRGANGFVVHNSGGATGLFAWAVLDPLAPFTEPA